MRMHLLYVHDQRIGYGRYGVNLARELEWAGVDVVDRLDLGDPNPATAACWVSVPAHVFGRYSGQQIYISTMWEARNLPESFRDGLDNFRRIIVPSDQNVELFSRYHDDVVKVPLGIDPVKWHYTPRQPPGPFFTYMIGGSGQRKGQDLAHAAFKRLWGRDGSWGDGPVPRIIFKSPKVYDVWGERIEKVSGWISEEQERDLYGSAHCYLQPSRGEGFGLQPLQAIAQGIPTILTDAHGHKDFAHLGYGISATSSKAEYFIHGDAGDWWEPSLDELCEYMHYVYYNYDEACSFARMAGEIAREQFTWKHTAEQFIDAIGMDALCAPYEGDREWLKITGRQYPVITNRFWPCSIAGVDYQFMPGEKYLVPADVKRILFDQEVLDPACIIVSEGEVTEDEVGLTQEQAEKVPQYAIARMHCQMCGQKLNSSPKWEPQFDDDGTLVG
jgi:glycosyltransferase involved in cell wall biosynthesis